MYSHPDFRFVVGSFPSYADSDIGASFLQDAIAANSVSSTFFQYLKVIVIAIAGASAVVIGKDIGSNDEEKVRCNGVPLSYSIWLSGSCLELYYSYFEVHCYPCTD